MNPIKIIDILPKKQFFCAKFNLLQKQLKLQSNSYSMNNFQKHQDKNANIFRLQHHEEYRSLNRQKQINLSRQKIGKLNGSSIYHQDGIQRSTSENIDEVHFQEVNEMNKMMKDNCLEDIQGSIKNLDNIMNLPFQEIDSLQYLKLLIDEQDRSQKYQIFQKICKLSARSQTLRVNLISQLKNSMSLLRLLKLSLDGLAEEQLLKRQANTQTDWCVLNCELKFDIEKLSQNESEILEKSNFYSIIISKWVFSQGDSQLLVYKSGIVESLLNVLSLFSQNIPLAHLILVSLSFAITACPQLKIVSINTLNLNFYLDLFSQKEVSNSYHNLANNNHNVESTNQITNLNGNPLFQQSQQFLQTLASLLNKCSEDENQEIQQQLFLLFSLSSKPLLSLFHSNLSDPYIALNFSEILTRLFSTILKTFPPGSIDLVQLAFLIQIQTFSLLCPLHMHALTLISKILSSSILQRFNKEDKLLLMSSLQKGLLSDMRTVRAASITAVTTLGKSQIDQVLMESFCNFLLAPSLALLSFETAQHCNQLVEILHNFICCVINIDSSFEQKEPVIFQVISSLVSSLSEQHVQYGSIEQAQIHILHLFYKIRVSFQSSRFSTKLLQLISQNRNLKNALQSLSAQSLNPEIVRLAQLL